MPILNLRHTTDGRARAIVCTSRLLSLSLHRFAVRITSTTKETRRIFTTSPRRKLATMHTRHDPLGHTLRNALPASAEIAVGGALASTKLCHKTCRHVWALRLRIGSGGVYHRAGVDGLEDWKVIAPANCGGARRCSTPVIGGGRGADRRAVEPRAPTDGNDTGAGHPAVVHGGKGRPSVHWIVGSVDPGAVGVGRGNGRLSSSRQRCRWLRAASAVDMVAVVRAVGAGAHIGGASCCADGGVSTVITAAVDTACIVVLAVGAGFRGGASVELSISLGRGDVLVLAPLSALWVAAFDRAVLTQCLVALLDTPTCGITILPALGYAARKQSVARWTFAGGATGVEFKSWRNLDVYRSSIFLGVLLFRTAGSQLAALSARLALSRPSVAHIGLTLPSGGPGTRALSAVALGEPVTATLALGLVIASR